MFVCWFVGDSCKLQTRKKMEIEEWLNNEYNTLFPELLDPAPPLPSKTEVMEQIRRNKSRILLIYVKQQPRPFDYTIMYCDPQKPHQWKFRNAQDYVIAPNVHLQGLKGKEGFTMVYYGINVTSSLFNSPNVAMSFGNRQDFIDIYYQIEALLNLTNLPSSCI
jgi:hypothetical protein